MAASGGAVAEHILQAQEADADARGRLGDMEAELAAKRRQLSTVIKDVRPEPAARLGSSASPGSRATQACTAGSLNTRSTHA